MGLVDYASDSDSDSDSKSKSAAQAPPTRPVSKKSFQKVVDRSNKIVVSLPQAASDGGGNIDEPPTKRARTTAGGGGALFSGLNSLLPAPKNSAAVKSQGGSGSAPGVHLKTSAAPGFSRHQGAPESSDGLALPWSAPSRKDEHAPSIPEGQKPADEVKLVGKPLKFRPLSVGSNMKKTKKKKTTTTTTATATTTTNQDKPNIKSSLSTTSSQSASSATEPPPPPPPPKKLALFSMHTEETSDDQPPTDGAYQPLFETTYPTDMNSDADAGQDANLGSLQPQPADSAVTLAHPAPPAQSLDLIANELNLSASARRELFGRDGSIAAAAAAAKKVVNFNMDTEYSHNQALREEGDQQIHNPVRAIQGGGKHSLKQLVHNVQNQKDALEDSFAKGKINRKEASGRYGW